ncbi:MAG: hypothetical protein S4CHLAM37_01540 [Chlamydiia bacterium]|nr:hypothetical protein [Chlamydiia bacterium]
MKLIARELEKKLKEYIGYFSVVGVTGPRQSGKSTLIKSLLKDYTYITFDKKSNVDLFYDDPEKFMRIHHNKVIFDEVQKAPEIFDHIKLAVDEDRSTTGKFVLTGSSQFTFSKNISESLAGRIGSLVLLPYEYSELPAKHREESVFKGAFPELVLKNYALFDDWYASYIETYIEKDLRSIANVGDLRDFQKLIQLLATNTAQILNYTTYSKHIGVDVKTIKRWVSILEASYIIFLLPPFYDNLGKRVIKSPKIYFYDVGLVSHLCGITSQDVFEKGPLYGAIFENYLVAELLKKQIHRKTHKKLYYFRTSAGQEIDLIIDHKQRKDLIEIKTSETFKPSMTSSIEAMLGKNDQGFLLYQGKEVPHLDNIQVVNFNQFLQTADN